MGAILDLWVKYWTNILKNNEFIDAKLPRNDKWHIIMYITKIIFHK